MPNPPGGVSVCIFVPGECGRVISITGTVCLKACNDFIAFCLGFSAASRDPKRKLEDVGNEAEK